MNKHLFVLASCLVLAGTSALGQGGIVVSTVEPGGYSDVDYLIYSPCGMAREDGTFISWDDPSVFGQPVHAEADFLWFGSGYLTWQHPAPMPSDAQIDSLSYIAEVSSEIGGANFIWPSDLTVSVNGVPIGTWTIPGDPNAWYGSAKQINKLEPWNSQYGWLTQWTVDSTGTYFEADFRHIPELGLGPVARFQISNVNIEDLSLVPGQPVSITLSVPGIMGMNLYGDTWGDYPVDPTLTVQFHRVAVIDIKPGSDPNSVNLGSGGTVPVAILSSAEFDATTVDPQTVTLAGAGVAARGKGSRPMAAVEDVNGDGLADLVVHILTENIDPELFDNGYAVLAATTFDGTSIEGRDEIRLVPRK
ncbi:MAG TPA: hypothetical protein P5555_11865 [Candidatus Paceibacterota bacterium]|nr:hypothetical protein [Verrucomicrobiota bacterium]HRZ45876.1 hypothetical protein [Candidatus Paceibacterota bacterium]